MSLLFYGHPIAAVARATGLSYLSVWRHAHGTRTISPESAMLYEKAVGIPRQLLRPDIWPASIPAEPTAQTKTTTKGDHYDRPFENLPF